MMVIPQCQKVLWSPLLCPAKCDTGMVFSRGSKAHKRRSIIQMNHLSKAHQNGIMLHTAAQTTLPRCGRNITAVTSHPKCDGFGQEIATTLSWFGTRSGEGIYVFLAINGFGDYSPEPPSWSPLETKTVPAPPVTNVPKCREASLCPTSTITSNSNCYPP